MEKLFTEIDRLEKEFIKIWVDIANIESPTEYKKGVDTVGEYFINFARKNGWQTEIFEQSKAGNIVTITMNAESCEAPITLSGHIDTVHPLGSFGTPAVRVEKDIIYGPGVTDCKGGTVAALFAMTALKNIGFNKRPLRLLLQTDEESQSQLSGKSTINYMCEKAADSIAFLNCESTRGNTAVLWRKGIACYRLDIKGQSVHASRCAEGGANAITEAAHKILELEKMKDVNGLTCNCGVINGGTASNSVPDNCSFLAEIRFNTQKEKEEGEAKITAVAKKSYIEGTNCEITQVTSRPAMEKAERNFALLDRLNEIYNACGLPILTARQSLGGSDTAEITVAGIPCIDSIGVEGDKIHSPNEYGIISSLAKAAKRIATACYYL